MKVTWLRPLYDEEGPFATVFLDASRTSETAGREVDLRWRALAESLRGDGAPAALVEALGAAALAKPGLAGPCTRVLVGADDRLLLDQVLPGRPLAERARWLALPDLLPLIEHELRWLPHALVEIDREGADIALFERAGGPPAAHTVRGDTENLSKTGGGGWAHRSMQARSEQKWEHNAREVAQVLDDLVRRVGIDLVAVTGDEQAVRLLEEHLSQSVGKVVHRLGTGGRAAGTSTEALEAELSELVQQAAEEPTRTVRAAFERERGQHDAAAEGLPAVVEALRRAQVETLLVAPAKADPDAELVLGRDPSALAATPEELRAVGAEGIVAAPAAAALLRAAVATDAEVVVLPGDVELRDGYGALLRYTDAAAR